MLEKRLSLWTVYRRPLDHPDSFVARRWEIHPEIAPTADVLLAHDLEALREMLPSGLVRLDRQPTDDPVIVESWV